MQQLGGPPENVRDVTFSEDTATSRTGRGPANLAAIRAAILAAIKDAGYLHVPEGRRDHTTPSKPYVPTASIRTETDIHGTRRSPALGVLHGSRRQLNRWRYLPAFSSTLWLSPWRWSRRLPRS
jgi:hypothetical protein